MLQLRKRGRRFGSTGWETHRTEGAYRKGAAQQRGTNARRETAPTRAQPHVEDRRNQEGAHEGQRDGVVNKDWAPAQVRGRRPLVASV